jgi:hypothetical protein
MVAVLVLLKEKKKRLVSVERTLTESAIHDVDVLQVLRSDEVEVLHYSSWRKIYLLSDVSHNEVELFEEGFFLA